MRKLLTRIQLHLGSISPTITPELYAKFVANGGAKNIRKLRLEFIEKSLNRTLVPMPKKFSNFTDDFNKLFIQDAISYIFWSDFVKACVYATTHSTKIKFPIPQALHAIFSSFDLKLSSSICVFRWKLILYKRALKNIFEIFIQIVKLFSKVTEISSDVDKERLRIWRNVSEVGYFESGFEGSFDFKNWITQDKILGNRHFEFFCERDLGKFKSDKYEVIYRPIRFLPLPNNRKYKYLLELSHILISGVRLMLLGKPEFMSQGMEIAQALRVEKVERHNLPQLAFFSEADGVKRPLWTYSAESLGVQIIVLFATLYSTPSTNKELVSSIVDDALSLYIGASWNNYWVVDEIQRDSLLQFTKLDESSFRIVGVPWRTDVKMPKEFGSRKRIAVFDYESHTDFYNFSSIVDVGYFDNTKELQFLAQIVKLAEIYDIDILHKRKRPIYSKFILPEYRDLIRILNKSNNYYQVLERTSPHQVIANCHAVLSLPFTTTAFIGMELGIKTLFYDPIGLINPNDQALHNIPLLRGYRELSTWFEDFSEG